MLPSTIIGDPELRLFKAICREFDACGFMPSLESLGEQIGVSRQACRLSLQKLRDAHWVLQLPDGGTAPARPARACPLESLSDRQAITLAARVLIAEVESHSAIAGVVTTLPVGAAIEV